ncbi:hypothetical protein [Rhodanobacter sp. A1T4]|uniref:hypothetical protein n=1 Tax=Rhodanobacter sp. A1T4 TaxID=2723087 RepID=UPI001611C088|nr:hypothetical protein [Rhodanobacter sp. A1T4]MBB6248264.1 hypothetical protein [Rhodanobacter sp. A1T4]
MNNIRLALYENKTTGAKKFLERQASLYEDETLAHALVPNECVALIVEIVSVKELFSKPGIEIFLVKTYSDMDRLTEEQKKEILDAAYSHFHEYEFVEFCWVLCDLIARCYSRAEAMHFFRKVFDTASAQGKKGVALGLDIIYRTSQRDPNLKNEISKILKVEASD